MSSRPISPTTSASSSSRPTNGVAGIGRVVLYRDFECWKRVVAELEDALGCSEVLEPVLAEITKLDLDQGRRGGRDEHLAAVSRGGDSRGAVDIVADVPLLAQ